MEGVPTISFIRTVITVIIEACHCHQLHRFPLQFNPIAWKNSRNQLRGFRYNDQLLFTDILQSLIIENKGEKRGLKLGRVKQLLIFL
jgi:hypothetical protein